jgi:hypothetical protein
MRARFWLRLAQFCYRRTVKAVAYLERLEERWPDA